MTTEADIIKAARSATPSGYRLLTAGHAEESTSTRTGRAATREECRHRNRAGEALQHGEPVRRIFVQAVNRSGNIRAMGFGATVEEAWAAVRGA